MTDLDIQRYFIVGDLYKVKVERLAFYIGEEKKSEVDVFVQQGEIITCISSGPIVKFVWDRKLLLRRSHTMNTAWFEKLEEK